jgi:hypothetical protein
MTIKTSDVGTGPSSVEPPDPIIPSPLPEEILRRMGLPLGFLTSDVTQSLWFSSSRTAGGPMAASAGGAVLAFLDKDFWVCAGDLGGSGAKAGVGVGVE